MKQIHDKNGLFGFFSHTSMEDIKGDNTSRSSPGHTTEKMVFPGADQIFHFDRALMENILTKTIWSRIKFQNQSSRKDHNLSSVDFTKPGLISYG